MAPRVNKRSTVYELCKKRIELKNKFLESHFQTNTDDFKLSMSSQQNCIVPNESPNMFESQQIKIDPIKVEPQSDSMSNKSEFCRENLNNLLEKVPVGDQGTDTNSWLKHEMLKKTIAVCAICFTVFENETVLMQHVKNFHGNKRGRPAIPVECSVCQMKFACKREHAAHYRTHSKKTYECPSCKKMCFYTGSHTCKKNLKKKPKQNVWDACKEVLTEKPLQQVSSTNFESVPKLPITKNVVYLGYPKNKIKKTKSKNFKQSLEKVIKNYRPLRKKKKIIKRSSLKSISSVQDSKEEQLLGEFKNFGDLQSDNQVYIKTEATFSLKSISSVQDSKEEQLLGEFKNFGDLQSDNPVYIKTEPTDLAEMDDPKFLCNICNMTFFEIEKYETHYSLHLDEELCQIKEGDEELHVCFVCGGCFTEMNAFQAHKLTHVDEKWSDIKKID